MDVWEIIGIVIVAAIVMLILFNLKDLFRYLKIRSM